MGFTPRSSRRRLANAIFSVDKEIEIRASLLRPASLGNEVLASSLGQVSEDDASDNFSNKSKRSPRLASLRISSDSEQLSRSIGASKGNDDGRLSRAGSSQTSWRSCIETGSPPLTTTQERGSQLACRLKCLRCPVASLCQRFVGETLWKILRFLNIRR